MPLMTLFPNIGIPTGELVEKPLAYLVERHHVCANKKAAPVVSPTEFKGGQCSKESALRVHFGVLDFDHLSAQQAEQVIEHVGATGVEFAVYSTFSHSPERDKWSFRMVVPFRRPVAAEHWESHWARLVVAMCPAGVSVDARCKDASRRYYLPSCPEDRVAHAFREHFEGAPFDIEAIPEPPRSHRASATIGREGLVLTVRDFARLAKKMDASKAPIDRRAAECLSNIVQGRPWAAKGNRDNLLSDTAFVLAREFPKLDVAKTASLFEESCQQVRAQGDGDEFTVEFVQGKLATKVAVIEDTHNALNAAELARYGFEGSYTPEQIEVLTAKGVHPKGYILQHGSAFYVWLAKEMRYQVFPGSSAAGQAGIQVLPALVHEVSRGRMTREGWRPYKIDEFVAEHGDIPDRVIGSMTASESKYDRATRTFTVADCPLRPLVPKYDERIATWLKLLGGAKHEQLANWIAWCTHLDSTCAMLVLEGESGVGKTLLADGLARLWVEHEPTQLEEAIGPYNECIVRCPLLFADEAIPKDRNGKHRFSDVRKLISKISFSVNQKYLPTREVLGSVRLIVAINSLGLLVGEAPESEQELRATLARILHIRPNPAASSYLKELVRTNRKWPPDAIAEHALWLRAQRPLPENAPRFLFEPEPQAELETAFLSASAVTEEICHWLLAFLTNPQSLYGWGKPPADWCWRVRITENGLYVSPTALVNYWRVYRSTNFSSRTIRSGWRAFCLTHSSFVGPTGVVHSDLVNLDRFISCCEEHGLATAGEVEGLMAKILAEDVYRQHADGPTIAGRDYPVR